MPSTARAALPLARLPLARYSVDRDAAARSRPELFDELLADPATRILPLWRGRALVADPARLRLFPVADVPSALVRVYLGRVPDGADAGAAVIATALSDNAARELDADADRWHVLREVAAGLDDRDAGLFTESLAIMNWHEANVHCTRCGIPTIIAQGGWVRACAACDSEFYPRTDAAVIAAVFDADDRLLLGSNAVWELNRWSILAGFVEPGESFEAAVAREVVEESGVCVDDIRYVGSQPWPFPASIMVGFTAQAAGNPRARPDGEEIVALRWFSRAELWRERDSLLLPGSSSIARAMIEQWYGGALDGPPLAGVS